MAHDENESSSVSRLPPTVARALAAAKSGAPGRKNNSGRWLALVPVVVAGLCMALMMPRGTRPSAVPLPQIDMRALEATVATDRTRAASARSARLPTDVLAVGSALRKLNTVASGPDAGEATSVARREMEVALLQLKSRDGAMAELLALRALQIEQFLAEVAHFESTGTESAELSELGGAFISRMREGGWVEGHRVVLDEDQRRVAYKIVWNTLVGVDDQKSFQLTLDEQRSLYSLYLGRPHPSESQRAILAADRRAARTAEACEKLANNELRATEQWRADKIKRFSTIDPSYPAAYALGVVYYRAGSFDLSVEAFRDWLDRHPDGPLALRAQNHLKAALDAHGAW